jgi:dihydroorotate dehydrogenase electron transfer subunit
VSRADTSRAPTESDHAVASGYRRLAVSRAEAVGAYTLLVLRNDGGGVGGPGQFFMLRADPEPADAYLPRALSAAWADRDEIAFLLDVGGAGTRALAKAGQIEVLGPLGRGFDLRPGRSVLVGGGIGAAILPWLVRTLQPAPAVLLGFRSEAHAVCAGLIDPDSTVVLDPVVVTEPLARVLPFDGTVYACGPDPMLQAVAALCAEHEVPCQLAMEAAMACGFGACYGCAVRIDGEWKRLCVEGPVLPAERVMAGA